MPRKSTLQELALRPPAKGQQLFRWAYEELRAAVLDGRLPPGARLPSTRNFAHEYGVARGTVLLAFEQLRAEGYLEARVGAGSFVSKNLPDRFLRPPAPPCTSKARTIGTGTLSRWAREIRTPFPLSAESEIGRPFQPNQPALDLFPLQLWSQLASRRLRRTSRTLLGGGAAAGYRPLREAVAAYLGPARGVRCTADQVIIVSGTQQSLDLCGRLLLDPGDAAWIEDPGYPGAAAVIAAAGGKAIPIPVDDAGFDVSAAMRKAPRAKLAYITPAHQFPLGVSLSLDRRMQLLRWAHETGSWIFEDDYDSEFRFVGRPLPALHGLVDHTATIFVGSFNKMLFPALRLGYIVLPENLVEPFCRARSLIDRFVPVLDQAVLTDFIAEGHFGQHLRRMREAYAERLEALTDEVARRFGPEFKLQRIQAGIQTPAFLPAKIPDREAARQAAAAGVEAMPLSLFQMQRTDINGLLLGFAGMTPETLRAGVGKLAAVLERMGLARKRKRRA